MLKERKYGDLCMSILSRFLRKNKIKNQVKENKQTKINYKNGTLMYKDESVAKLKEGDFGQPMVENITNKDMLPVGVLNSKNNDVTDLQSISENLGIWLEYRTVPNSRPNIDKCLEKWGMENTDDLSCRALRLSLSDSYWFKPDGIELTWDDVNLYRNGFSEDVGKTMFNPENETSDIDFLTPDATTRGEDIKRWICDEHNDAYLIKTNDAYEQVAYNELIANMICDKLGIICAEYLLIKSNVNIYNDTNKQYAVKDCTFSKSKNFCRENTTYVPADYLRIITEKNNVRDLIDIIKNKNPDVYDDFVKMLVLDFLIDNKDRHSENFGFEFDENGKIHFAPIFDNGNSLYYDDGLTEFGYMHKCKFGAFYDNKTMLDEYISSAKQMQFFDISKFTNIKQEIFNILDKSNLSKERIFAIANFVEHQTIELQKFKEQLVEMDISNNYEEELR